jgi:hypothetical protein
MKLFALYLSAGRTTVKSTSRAGFGCPRPFRAEHRRADRLGVVGDQGRGDVGGLCCWRNGNRVAEAAVARTTHRRRVTFAALVSHGRGPTQGSQSSIVSRLKHLMGFSEHRCAHQESHSRQRA